MTGAGTDWTTSLSPGDSIFPATKNPWVVVSVDSDTQIHYRTTNLTGMNFSGVSLSYQIAHPWQPGNCGWSFWAKHQGYSPVSPTRSIPALGRHLDLPICSTINFSPRRPPFWQSGWRRPMTIRAVRE